MNNEVIKLDAIKTTFSNWEAALNGRSNDPIVSTRRQALEQFADRGFPGRKEEAWKYTNLEKVLKMGFAPITDFEPGDLADGAFDSMKISADNTDVIRLVFVDGHFSEKHSAVRKISGFEFQTLRSKSEMPGPQLDDQEGMVHLNTAFAIDGAVINIQEKAVVETPIEIYNITTCPGDKMIQPRHHVQVGKAAQATIIESYHNLCVGQSFTNCVHTIDVADDAHLTWIKIEHPKQPNTFIIDHTVVNQGASSNFKLYTLTLSGGLVRNNVYVGMKGEHSEAHLLGLYVLEHDEHADNRTIVDHAVPNCFSNELYKGILDGSSTGVFNGKIIVREDAQKTNAYQNNRNILMSDHATINTKPQLEIYADDVKCSHGATSAQIEDSELFYLRTRGIGKAKARALLMYAFAGEIWEDIRSADVRKFIEREVSHALGMETL